MPQRTGTGIGKESKRLGEGRKEVGKERGKEENGGEGREGGREGIQRKM